MPPRHDPLLEIHQIVRFTLLAFSLAVAVTFALIILIPFDVGLQARLTEGRGLISRLSQSGNPQDYSDAERINVRLGETLLSSDPDNRGRLEIVEGLGAYAYVTGLVEIRLTEAKRRGTALEHIAGRNLSYFLTLEQSAGVVVYDFSQADPPLSEIDFLLRLPQGEFSPTFPCFQANAEPESPDLAVVEIPCYSQIQAQQAR